jgi:hypothetical protein
MVGLGASQMTKLLAMAMAMAMAMAVRQLCHRPQEDQAVAAYILHTNVNVAHAFPSTKLLDTHSGTPATVHYIYTVCGIQVNTSVEMEPEESTAPARTESGGMFRQAGECLPPSLSLTPSLSLSLSLSHFQLCV